MAKLKELYQHELDYMNSLSQLTPSAPKAPDPVVTAVQDIEASVQRIVEEEQEDLEDTKELPTEELDAEISEEKPGGLYGELTATFLDRDGETERKMKVNPERRAVDRAEGAPSAEEPTKRLNIDLEHLQFGKDYEIK